MKRREFIAGFALTTAATAAPTRSVSITTPPDEPATRAAGELEDALAAHGVPIRPEGDLRIHAAIAPQTAESFSIAPADNGIAIIGGDSRGLTYALLELADRVRHSDQPYVALDIRTAISAAPANRIRGVMKCFVSDVEDKPWYNDREMWPRYLSMLAAQRFNRFQLAFGIGYDSTREMRDCYFHFAFPFLLNVPGYKVRARGLPEAERDRNREMLRFISSEASARGLHFQLGLWNHAYEWADSPDANYIIEGLTPQTHAAYCRDALHQLLTECPGISGVTFRINGDHDFWKTMYDGIMRTGRKLEIDMHAKGIDDRMIDTALATGMPVNISPKYMAEHMGLPYNQAPGKFPRSGCGILHRLWPGTQRMLLWGDPVMAAAFSRQSSFCGDGLELFEPLSFKGCKGSGLPGGRLAYADAALDPASGDWEKYVYTYRVWGRALYHPDADPDGYRRYLRHTFEHAAKPVEAALSHASRILPLITNAHGAHNYWPEIYTNMPIVEGGGAAGHFGGVSPFDPEFFATIDEFASELVAGKRGAKYSPLETAAWLEDLAAAAMTHLRKAQPQQSGPEFRRLAIDVAIQASTGRFFAAKLRSGVFYAVYDQTGDRTALDHAIRSYREARIVWTEIVQRTKPVYRPDITYGWDAAARGHWSDRVAAMDGDIAAMQKLRDMPKPVTGQLHNLAPRAPAACHHIPPERFQPGEPLTLAVSIERRGVVTLHYRHANKSGPYQTIRLEKNLAIIPAQYTQSKSPILYYFDMDGSLYPGLDATLSNQPYFVVRSGAATSAAG